MGPGTDGTITNHLIRMADAVTARRAGESETIGGNDLGGHTTPDHNEVQSVAPGSHSETREDSVDAKPISTLSSHPPAMDNSASTGTLLPPEQALSVPAHDTTPSKIVQADGDSSDARGFNIGGYMNTLNRVFSSSSNNVHDVDDSLFTTATGKDDERYCLTEGKKMAIVFNHEVYDPVRDLSKRSGTESDAQVIDSTFKKMGFELHTYDDLRVDGIRRVIRGVQTCREEIACLAVFILTHGEENGILHAYDDPYRLDKEIINELLPERCPTLVGKPKLIFVQACQGNKTDEGTVVATRHRHTSTDGGIAGSNYRIPHHSDFLIFQAAYHGYYSFRSGSGSWFIQSFCKCLMHSKCDDDILAILTRTKHYVACYKTSNVPSNPSLDQKKQIPLVQDTLIRRLYLKEHLSDPQTSQRALSVSPELQRRNGSMRDTRKESSSLPQKKAIKKSEDKCLCM